jgi:hypothetical protein
LTAIGAVFAICGVWVWGMAARQHVSNRRRQDAMLLHSGETVLADDDWDPRGFPSKELFDVTGSGSDQCRRLVHHEQWSGTWLLDHAREFHAGEQVDLRYRSPADLPETQLAADQPVFWEFEAKPDLQGFDFEEIYLVPVYAESQWRHFTMPLVEHP